jgi:hypothetical protein
MFGRNDNIPILHPGPKQFWFDVLKTKISLRIIPVSANGIGMEISAAVT